MRPSTWLRRLTSKERQQAASTKLLAEYILTCGWAELGTFFVDTVAMAGGDRRFSFQEAEVIAMGLTGPDHCGAIHLKSLLRPRPNLFAELHHFNGCLNRKVSLRADGSICNCPSMRASFGADVSKLADVVRSPEFQKPWRLNKDRFETCHGCEFRYVCTDCRAYLESDLSLGKPARCSYDPATGIWAGSETPSVAGAS